MISVISYYCFSDTSGVSTVFLMCELIIFCITELIERV